MNKLILWLLSFLLLFSASIFAQINVTYTINTNTNRTAISPYIYGTNGDLAGNENFSSFRSGGNRLTGYNWENNFSSAGSDYQHSSDNYLVYQLPAAQQTIPGIIALNLIDKNPGKYKLFTLPMAGYVSRDDKGTVATGQAAPSNRWRQVVNKKGSAFTLTPDTTDASVYVDEFINYMNVNRGKSNAGGINAYIMDNEPDLWSSTHPRIHSSTVGAAELVNKTIALSKTVKDMDATAEVFGYESYGFSGYLNLQSAPDWNNVKGSNYWYIDYYLSQMNTASVNDGRRLLDVLSLHWYPEARGDNRINDGSATSTNDKVARMQAPRTLWDSSYAENSWIEQNFAADLPLIPRVQKSISQYYAGTKLAFTEYNYGDFNDVSSGIAQADVLGIFGKFGVYEANYWNLQTNVNYTSAGFKIFRNYNGNNSTFGNTTVYSKVSDKQNSSVYTAIIGTDDSVLTMVVINKNLTNSINGQFAITSATSYSTAEVWGFDANNATITSRSGIASISGNNFNYSIPALSVLFFKIKTNAVTVTPAPTITSTTSDSRCGAGTLTLGASSSSGTINWYADSVSGSILSTGPTYTTTVTSTTIYYVDATDNGSTTAHRTAVNATIHTVPTATISGNTTVCSGSTGILNITLTGTSPWTFDYGTGIQSNHLSSITTPSYTIAVSPGTYTVAAISDSSGCLGTTNGISKITENTTITTSNLFTSCNPANSKYILEFDISGGDTLSYSITGGTGSKTTATHFKSDSVSSGATYSLTVTDVFNCAPVLVAGTKNCTCSATANISGGGSFCSGNTSIISITLAGVPPWRFTYSVDGVDQPEITDQHVSTYTFVTSTSGIYSLTSVYDSICQGSVTGIATVIINPLPTIIISSNPANATICMGHSISLMASGAASYLWSDAIVNGQSFIPSITKTYNVTGTDANSCSNTASYLVSVNNLPTVTINSNRSSNTICSGDSLILTGSGAVSYLWSGGIINGQSFVPPITTTYTVTGTDANNCTNKAEQTLIIDSCLNVGMNAINAIKKTEIYPNPTTGILNVILKNPASTQIAIRIFDLRGIEVFCSINKNIPNDFVKQIDLGYLDKGIYFIRIITGMDALTEKVIIERCSGWTKVVSPRIELGSKV